MDVVVQVGGWEHSCCGPSIERYQLVDLGCLRTTSPTDEATLVETHHHLDPQVRVRGRVHDIQVLDPEHGLCCIERLPSGQALRGFDPEDDGHLQEAWSEVTLPAAEDFLVTIRVSAPPTP